MIAETLLQNAEIEWFRLGMKIFGGLALFLFGMERLSDVLTDVAGNRMRRILSRLTSNRYMGLLTGTFLTSVLQSSSVTTVLIIGFISAGLMTLSQAAGVILGANIGTTITAQVIAFKVTKYALLLVAVGYGLSFVTKRRVLKKQGQALMGLGLLFFGMALMGEAMAPMRHHEPFLNVMTKMENPLLGILAGAAFTAIVQSSSATTGVVIVLASQGLIRLEAGIALILGANIGTCVTALLASIGRPREALRAAILHVLFKVVGVGLWFYFISDLARFVTWFSPSSIELQGVDRLAADTPRQLANAHTAFNVVNSLLFLPTAGLFVGFVEWLVPDAKVTEDPASTPKYLDDSLLNAPTLALERVRLELLRQGANVRRMLVCNLGVVLDGNEDELRKMRNLDDQVDALHASIVRYLGKVSQEELLAEDSERALTLLGAANELENIGDIIETNLFRLGKERLRGEIHVSPQTRELLEEFLDAILSAFDSAVQAVTQEDFRAAKLVRKLKPEILHLSEAAKLHEASRLVAKEPGRVAAYTLEIDILENFRRIYHFCKRMARGVPKEKS